MSRGGRTHGRARLPVESCHSLSAWGYFQEAQLWAHDDAQDSFEWEFDGDARRAVIRFTRDGQAHTQEIALVTTRCRFGGVRFWFACPTCSRRVGKVYLPCTLYADWLRGLRVTRFLCRMCYGLTYEQRRERAPYWSLIHRRTRLESRWLGEIKPDFVCRQKGQHWTTFDKRFGQWESLIEKHEATADAGIIKLARRLGYAFGEVSE